MKSDKELLFAFLNDVRAGIVADLSEKEISDSDLDMLVVADDQEAVLVGDGHYFFILAKGTRRKPEGGRRPGPVSEEGQAGIVDWVRKKGIEPEPQENADGTYSTISEKSLVYLIARKLKEHGNDIYMGKRPGLDLDKIIDQMRAEFKQQLRDKYREYFRETIGGSLRQLFNPA